MEILPLMHGGAKVFGNQCDGHHGAGIGDRGSGGKGLGPGPQVGIGASPLYGGRAYYIPTGDHLKAALRDRAIWDEFNGRNIDQLARKHGLSVPQTYAVVAEQRQLTRRRHQPDLFGYQ
ncbi:Mor transcription activator family protein [Aeromonas caviae]|uniref:Mor transcription activator family protein n=1 Tax=Aeromonas caviae TaxID=648 RepID=UPI0038D01A4C